MIQNYTYMDVADNSGAKQAMCFHVFGGRDDVMRRSEMSSWWR